MVVPLPEDIDSARVWRLQNLLSIHPEGIPSLAIADLYETAYGEPLDVREMGFEHLSEMINSMPDIIAVQTADESTAVLFPDYPKDVVLHDARYGHRFAGPDLDSFEGSYEQSKIYRAWLSRDVEFPSDVVLPGELCEQFLPLTEANIAGTRGLYQGTIVSVANPESFYVRLKSTDTQQMLSLTRDIEAYFERVKLSIDSYNVPREFLFRGFPCLSYVGKDKAWERCVIVGNTKDADTFLVESVDYGGVYAATILNLFLIPRPFLRLPRQTIHCCLPGLKPSNGVWSTRVGSRMRCFSFDTYWLDLVLIEQKQLSTAANSDKLSARASGPIFEAIIVDRHDADMDIYLDEILALETYANYVPHRQTELNRIKSDLKTILTRLPRPENPFDKL